jgi:hypothetical protein
MSRSMMQRARKILESYLIGRRDTDPVADKRHPFTAAQRGLGELPTELQSDIFQRLGDPREVASLRLVCKAWKVAAEGDSIWRAFEQPVAKIPEDAAARLWRIQNAVLEIQPVPVQPLMNPELAGASLGIMGAAVPIIWVVLEAIAMERREKVALVEFLRPILDGNAERCGKLTPETCRMAAELVSVGVSLQPLKDLFPEISIIAPDAVPDLRTILVILGGVLGIASGAVLGAVVGFDHERILTQVRYRSRRGGAQVAKASAKCLDALQAGVMAGVTGAMQIVPARCAAWLQHTQSFAERMRVLHTKMKALVQLRIALMQAVEAADSRMMIILENELNPPLHGGLRG